MEDCGKLRARFYVIKTSGIFAKGARILEIHDKGLLFLSVTSSKDREYISFKDGFEVLLADRNERDFQLKVAKSLFTISCAERTRLLTDLYLYKVGLPNPLGPGK